MNDTKKKNLHNPKSNAPAIYIPCWLSQVPVSKLSHGAKLVYGRLSQWSDQLGHAFRSVPQLSKEIGMCESSVEKFQKELRDKGLIGTYHPQAGGLNHFEFYDHEWMHEPITPELCYQQESPTYPQAPPYNHTVPPVSSYGTPPYKHTGINKKEIKRNKKDINNVREQKEKNETTKQKPHAKTFEQFWEAYPVKKGRKPAFEIWNRKKLWAIIDDIIESIESHKQHDKKWLDGYIPNPTTFLNQERWQDEITVPVREVAKEKSKQETAKRIAQQEQASKEKLTHEQIKQEEIKSKGKFKKIIGMVLNEEQGKAPPIKQLNALLQAGGSRKRNYE